MIRVDLHVHSEASFDCAVPLEDLARRSRQLGLSPIVLTDHDTIEGAIRLRKSGSPVVVGQEISTAEGEMIGLFLTEAVPPDLPAADTARRIHDQGGVVYIQHPYDEYRRRLPERTIESIAEMIDVVEVFNGRCTPLANRRAKELQEALGVPAGAGSDAHTLAALGSVYVEMEKFDDAGDFLLKLARGRIVVNQNRAIMGATAALRAILRG